MIAEKTRIWCGGLVYADDDVSHPQGWCSFQGF